MGARAWTDGRNIGTFSQDKYKTGNGTLKLRDEMMDELEHWAMAPAAGHARFDVYPSVMPVGYACKQAEDEAAPNKICPAGSLYTEDQMKVRKLNDEKIRLSLSNES